MPASPSYRGGRLVPPQRLTALVMCVLVAAALLMAAGAAPARAEEVSLPGPDRTFSLEGRGYGHGAGMSQYGAKGGADQGHNAHEILARYYPGTSLVAGPSSDVRVLLSRYDGATDCRSEPAAANPCFRVLAEPGQTMTDRATGTTVVPPATIEGQQVTTVAVGSQGNGLTLWAYAGTWTQLQGSTVYAGPIDVRGDGIQQLGWSDGVLRSYRGTLRAVWAGTGLVSRVDVLPMEQYLLGVVPAEMPASWATAAVQAQAVAARTYTAAAMRSPRNPQWDICDTVSCQVYAGVGGESATATAKIASASPSDVRGRVLTSGGVPITAFYSSSNGGWSLPANASYLVSAADSWDPVNPWTRTVSAACLESRYPGRGALQRLVVTRRDGNGPWGGRVTAMRLDFAAGSVSFGGTSSPFANDSQVRTSMTDCGAAGILRSSWLRVVPPADPLSAIGVSASDGAGGDLVTRLASGQLAHRAWSDAYGLSGLYPLGGLTSSAPALARSADGRLDALVTGTNGTLYVSGRPAGASSWSTWAPVPGVAVRGRPGAAYWPDGTLHVFSIGSDDALWHTWRTAAGQWVGWESLGGVVAPDAGASVATASDRSLWISVRGTDGRTWVKAWAPGRGWQVGWTGLGGASIGDPAIAVDGSSQLPSVLVRGTDDIAWTQEITAAGPQGWRSLGGVLGGAPAAATAGSTGLVVLTVGSNGLAYKLERNQGAWSGWRRLG